MYHVCCYNPIPKDLMVKDPTFWRVLKLVHSPLYRQICQCLHIEMIFFVFSQ